MKIAKSVSLVCLMTLCGGVVDNAHAVSMTPQIQRLLNEKQEKMAELEKCEGKKKGFMIAGLSTIGLTAGGVVLNIVQANKINKLSDELDRKNIELSKQQETLSAVNAKISDKYTGQKLVESMESAEIFCDKLNNGVDKVYVYENNGCYVSKVCADIKEIGVEGSVNVERITGDCGNEQVVLYDNEFCIENVPTGTECVFTGGHYETLYKTIDEIVNNPNLVFFPKEWKRIDSSMDSVQYNEIKALLPSTNAKMEYEATVDEGEVLRFNDGKTLIVQHLRSDKYYGEKKGEPAIYSSDLYTNSQNDNVKKYCYCRIIEPAVSAWVFYAKKDNGFLDQTCKNICIGEFIGEPKFRQAVFKSFSN